MSRPRLLDLFCCAGGAAMGYYRAGFDVVGVDIKPQPRYPFLFILGDVIDILSIMLKGEKILANDGKWYGIEDFDAIHASPPCQEYSSLRSLKTKDFPKLIKQTRDVLIQSGKPYSMENVPGAPLVNPLLLCGTMFGLRVQRHRYFENNINLHFAPYVCNHWGKTPPRNDKRGKDKSTSLERYDFITVTGHDFRNADASIAMGINWMTNAELAEAIPPAYTEFIGKHLMKAINHETEIPE